MLSRERAAHINHALHESLADVLNLLELAGLRGIKQEVGVQVAVSRMEDVDGADARGIGLVVDQLQHLGERPLGNHSILHDVIGAQLTHQPAGHLPGLPQLVALLLLVAEGDFLRSRGAEHLRHRFDPGIDKRCGPVDLREQHEGVLP